MRYIAKSSGRLLEVSFGAEIQCDGVSCVEYTGGVPAGYSSLADWFTQEGDKLHRWRIVDGELVRIESPREPTALAPFRIYKIWENPATEEAFTSQRLQLDMLDLFGVFVYFKSTAAGTAGHVSGIIPVGREAYVHGHDLNGDTCQRLVKPTEDGVEFEAGYKGSTEDDTVAVPIEIYALSGLIDKTAPELHAICGMFLCGEVVAGQ